MLDRYGEICEFRSTNEEIVLRNIGTAMLIYGKLSKFSCGVKFSLPDMLSHWLYFTVDSVISIAIFVIDWKMLAGFAHHMCCDDCILCVGVPFPLTEPILKFMKLT